jgi:hypothetical protein
MKIILRNSIQSRGCRGAVSQKLYFCPLVLLRLCEALPFTRQRLLCGKFMQNENTKTTKKYRHRCAISHIFQIMHISHINWECFWNYRLETGFQKQLWTLIFRMVNTRKSSGFFQIHFLRIQMETEALVMFSKKLILINPLWQP